MYPYLEDADLTPPPPSPTGAFNLDRILWPRLNLTENKSYDLTVDQFGKYNVIRAKGDHLDRLKAVKVKYPDVILLRHQTPNAFQGPYNESGKQSQMPFARTGSVTCGTGKDASVFAGHWMYEAGTLLAEPSDEKTLKIKVKDPRRILKGRYVVIYDPPVGSFANAEHAFVQSVEGKTVTLEKRGHSSIPRPHPASAIMAVHSLGQGPNPQLWQYNQSLTCPKDGNGKTLGEAMADWLAGNLCRDENGTDLDVTVDGIIFDADFYFLHKSHLETDVNNDLVPDSGMIGGISVYGEGMERFYSLVRERLPNKILVGGDSEMRGIPSVNGTQMENWPAFGKFKNFDHALQGYSFHMHHHKIGPRYTEALVRLPTKIWPFSTERTKIENVASNAPFRFGFGMVLLEDGFYGKENCVLFPDPWYDEFAINVLPDSPEYGAALAANDPQIHKHRGWMGRPLGPRKRLYNDAFGQKKSLLKDGSFETNEQGWSGQDVRITRDDSAAMEGKASLKAEKTEKYHAEVLHAKVSGPEISLEAETEYTVCFSVKSSAVREFTVGLAGVGYQWMFAGTDWIRCVATFISKAAGPARLQFGVGRERTDVWFDEVYVFKGNPNLFRRDFDHAVVIVNARNSPQTVELGGEFQRIKGKQDPINDGSVLKSVTVQPHDAAILVKKNHQGVRPKH